jgi:hypothetical protein
MRLFKYISFVKRISFFSLAVLFYSPAVFCQNNRFSFISDWAPGNIECIFSTENYFYFITDEPRLYVSNVHHLITPDILSSIELPQRISKFIIDDHFALLLTKKYPNNDLMIVDLTDVEKPKLTSIVKTDSVAGPPNTMVDIVTQGSYFIVSRGYGGISVFDASDIANVTEAANYFSSHYGGKYHLIKRDSMLIVHAGYDGLINGGVEFYDISDLPNMRAFQGRNTISYDAFVKGITANHRYLFVNVPQMGFGDFSVFQFPDIHFCYDFNMPYNPRVSIADEDYLYVTYNEAFSFDDPSLFSLLKIFKIQDGPDFPEVFQFGQGTHGTDMSINSKNIFVLSDSGDVTIFSKDTSSAIVRKDESHPNQFSLAQNYPNPFNPTTNINYRLPRPCHVTLKIYNLFGREIATLADDFQDAGEYKIAWNAEGFSSGLYLYQLQTDGFTERRKLILQK